jgi:hypothetical protein
MSIIDYLPEELLFSFFIAMMLTPKRIILDANPFAGFIYSAKLCLFLLPPVCIVNYFFSSIKER